MGGTVHPINAAVDCRDGIGTWDWPEVSAEAACGQSLKYAVPMSYIESLFQMGTWQREFDLRNWKTFHIPRTGAISVNMNNFTTMPWSEEVRAAKEEFEESLNAADPDEPAAKKREIATGEAVISSPRCGEELESKVKGVRAPPLVQTVKQQERNIKTRTMTSRKQPRNKKRAKKNVTDDKYVAPNRGNGGNTDQKAERGKVTMDPEKLAERSEKSNEKAVEDGLSVGKHRPKSHVPEETETVGVPRKETSIAEAQKHRVTPKEQSAAEEPTQAMEVPAVSEQKSSSEKHIVTAPPSMSKSWSPAREGARNQLPYQKIDLRQKRRLPYRPSQS